MKLHHVGCLVKNMEKAVSLLTTEGPMNYSVISGPVFDPYRKINICFLENNGTLIELIESASPDSSVAGLLKKYGAAPYHICYEVQDIEKAVSGLRTEHFVVSSAPMPAPALEGKRVAFLYHAQIGLIELLEE